MQFLWRKNYVCLHLQYPSNRPSFVSSQLVCNPLSGLLVRMTSAVSEAVKFVVLHREQYWSAYGAIHQYKRYATLACSIIVKNLTNMKRWSANRGWKLGDHDLATKIHNKFENFPTHDCMWLTASAILRTQYRQVSPYHTSNQCYSWQLCRVNSAKLDG